MARYRNVSTDFWLDPFILDLTPEEKYFYLYLMTNKHASFCGIYQIHKKVMEMETGYNRDTVEKLLDRFREYNKLEYNDQTNELIMFNWVKYNQPNNVNVVKGIVSELEEVKTLDFIVAYVQLALTITKNDKHKELLKDVCTRAKQGATKGLGRGLQVIEIEIEIEIEREIESKEEVADKSATSESPKVKNTPYQKIIDTYNSICSEELPKVIAINDKRRTHMRTLWRFLDEDMDKLKEIFNKAIESDFLSGRNGSWNGCSFDWLINQSNAIKVLEGNYDNKEGGNNGKSAKGSRGESQGDDIAKQAGILTF